MFVRVLSTTKRKKHQINKGGIFLKDQKGMDVQVGKHREAFLNVIYLREFNE